MALPIEMYIDVYLVNSKIHEVSEIRRKIGVLVLRLARWILKSELRIEEVEPIA